MICCIFLPDDSKLANMNAKGVYEEIKEANKRTYLFAFKLLPIITTQEIRSRNLKSDERLLKMVEEYMKLFRPKPSWEGIADALNSKLVKLPEVAERIETKYCQGIVDLMLECVISHILFREKSCSGV